MTKALLLYAVVFLIVSSRLGWEAMLLSLVAFAVGVGGGGAWADESSDGLPRAKFEYEWPREILGEGIDAGNFLAAIAG